MLNWYGSFVEWSIDSSHWSQCGYPLHNLLTVWKSACTLNNIEILSKIYFFIARFNCNANSLVIHCQDNANSCFFKCAFMLYLNLYECPQFCFLLNCCRSTLCSHCCLIQSDSVPVPHCALLSLSVTLCMLLSRPRPESTGTPQCAA